MATFSQVKVALDDIAGKINSQREAMKKAKSNAAGASQALAAIQTDYADVITTINSYGTINAAEAAVKAEFAKMVEEFGTLKTVADGVAGINV